MRRSRTACPFSSIIIGGGVAVAVAVAATAAGQRRARISNERMDAARNYDEPQWRASHKLRARSEFVLNTHTFTAQTASDGRKMQSGRRLKLAGKTANGRLRDAATLRSSADLWSERN